MLYNQLSLNDLGFQPMVQTYFSCVVDINMSAIRRDQQQSL
eukprot:UN10940